MNTSKSQRHAPTPEAAQKLDAQRGLATSRRMRDMEMPPMEKLAQQRYTHITPSKPQLRPSATTAASGRRRSADPCGPLRAVRVPATITQLLKTCSHTTVATLPGNAAGSEETDQAAAATATTALAAFLDCAVHERIGVLYHPLGVARTAYGASELEAHPPPGMQGRDATPPVFGSAAVPAGEKTYFDIADFDASDDDVRTPQEWVASGDGGGTPATSRFFDGSRGGSVVWQPCRVTDYDADRRLFYIRWTDGTGRWTRRLNVRFDAEDLTQWEARVRRADAYRRDTEAAIRQELYLQSIPDTCVTPIDEAQVERVLRAVATRFPVAQLHVIQEKTEEAEATYYRAMKLAVHTYHMRSAAEQQRLQAADLPHPTVDAQPSLRGLRGTIDTPSPNFAVAKAYLAENCFQVHALIQDTLHTVHTAWTAYSRQLLCVVDYAAATLPLQLSTFVASQEDHAAATGQRLRGEWSSTVQSTVQNNLDAHFNFYEDNMERYLASRMHRFVQLINMMMNTQLRGLVVQSLQTYASYLETYRVPASSGEGDAADAAELAELPEDAAERAHLGVCVAQLESGEAAHDAATVATAAASEEKKTTKTRAGTSERKKPKNATAAVAKVAAPADGASGVAGQDHLVWTVGAYRASQPYTRRAVRLIQHVNGLQPLFFTRLVVSAKGGIAFDPPISAMEESVLRVVDGCLARTEHVAAMGDQLFPLLELAPQYVRTLMSEDAELIEVRRRISAVLEGNRDAPRQLLQMYKEFEYLATVDVAAVVQRALQRVDTLAEVELLLQRLVRDQRRLRDRTPDTVKFELYAVDCRGLKEKLSAMSAHLLHSLLEAVGRRLAEECASVITAYNKIHAPLAVDPTTPEELQAMRQNLDSVAARETAIQQTFRHVTHGNELLLQFSHLVPQEDFVRYWEAYEWPRKLAQFVEDRNFRAKEYRAVFMQQLRDNTEQLSYAIMQLAATVEDFTHLGEDARAEEFYERARGIDASIQACKASIALYTSHEELFGMTPTQYPQLKEIQQQFEPYYALWEILCHFNAETERWMSSKISSLQPADVDKKVTEWVKRVAVLSKKIKEPEASEVARQLRGNMDQFKPLVPLLYALRSHLQAVHWRAIYQQCGVPREQQGFGPGGVDNNDQRPLAEFVRLGLMDHLSQVEGIASAAQKSYELEAELMTMETEWKRLVFDMEPYQDTFKLKSNDAMQLTLDEHILKTQSMLGKPAVRQTPALQARVVQWEKQLDNIQCTMDEWFRYQGTWAYLEPIFASADISRSLPAEKKLFVDIDVTWHTLMERTRSTPQILTRCQDETLFKALSSANTTLEVILRKLQQFLETKRMAFPRFYFISNEELLQILSDSRDPYLVQPYLCKCFEGIKSLTFADHHDMVGMESAEGERVPFVRRVNPCDYHNQVELWLQAVETTMRDSVRDQLRQATADYATRKRTGFIQAWPGQVVIAVCSLFWTMEATQAMAEGGTVGLLAYHEKCAAQMDDLIVLVRDSGLGPVERCTLEALVVIEVHAKDIIRMLGEKGVDSPTSFDWLSQLRYYWDGEHLTVQQINAALRYGYEYLGNTGRLVITPLTDRCYRTLLGALHLNYGGAPEGPAGTGKTETTKDLAKALGKYCVVYNCSDQISAKDMAKLFKGLTQSGAWGCFDEFNRIEIQVLSVIAQQIATIQEAVIQKRPEFLFEGAQIKMDPGCAIFITMNPGYAGRAELPDNLKALFRPVAMMVPNYAMIGEIQLYSYGFLHGKVLSEKIVATYRLCSEQLSSQDHYDYGMRAVKAVLTAAGRLKRAYPNENEMVLMLRSIQDVNLPKFLSQDVELFKGIVSDLFPGVRLPSPDYAYLHQALLQVTAQDNLQLTSYFEEKVYQTYEMICVRHGMMLVGHSYGGKTKGLHSLAAALGVMEQANGAEHRARVVTINPKSVTMAQLYGKVEQSGEWTDGILSSRFRQLAQDTSEDRVWLALDGPVDAVWIENMNTVLDDNKKLCLQNGDIIPMSKRMNLVFEVQDLAHASPATVSRCGMVYVEPQSLGWRCLIESYLQTLPPYMTAELPASRGSLAATLQSLVDAVMDGVLEAARKRTTSIIPQSQSTLVASCIKLLSSFLSRFDDEQARERVGGDAKLHARNMTMRVEGWFIFALVWSVGGCLEHRDREVFSAALHDVLAEAATAAGGHSFTVVLPEKTTSFFEVRLEEEAEVRFATWQDLVPELTIPDDSEYQDIRVPTMETAKYSFLMRLMVHGTHPAMLVGDTGTGKTIMMKALLQSLPKESYTLNAIQFSAQTSANHLQRLIDGSCEKRRKGFYGPPINKRMVIFIDDANLPQLEEYGAQPPIELLRQYLDHGGWYQHSKDGIEFRHLVDALLLCAMGPPGGGRNVITPRFSRHFNAFSVPSFSESTLATIFGRLSEWILSRGFPSGLRALSVPLVSATVELYTTLVDNLKPSPEKSHYTFNLRDVSKVFQGMGMAYAFRIKDELCLAQLWMHEVSRAFADRFTDDVDAAWFHQQASTTCVKHFKMNVHPTNDDGSPLLFSSLANEDGQYERITDVASARATLEQKQTAFNAESRSGELNLVVFNYVLEHVARISRVLRQPGGHAMLIGVGGSGRRSCARLAAYLQECDFRTTTATKDYDHGDFLDDVRQLLLQTGQKGFSTAFVLADSQIVSEVFLEDICSLLNTGEIPGLWDTKQDRDAYENALAALRDVGRGLGRPDTTEALQVLFVERCRKHLHLVLCFSPLGSVLRERLRKFPSLVNCTTIDWFREWPEDGLRSVAARFLADVDLTETERTSIREIFVQYQQEVRELSRVYLTEARQQTYVTPTSYLDLLSTFGRMLAERRTDLTAQRDRYVNGLRQLRKTENQVEVMQEELARLQPELATKQAQTDELIRQVEAESKLAEAQKASVAVDEAAANAQATAAKKIKDASQEKVEEAQPLVEQAQRAVQDLDPKALQEVKALKAPPLGVKFVIEVLCTLLGGTFKPKPVRDAVSGKTTVPYWEHAKVTLLTGDFKNLLLNAYPDIVDNAPDAQIEEVKRKMADEMFKMENIRKTSVALIGVATYIQAVVEYYKQNKVIKPLLAQAAAAQAEFDEAMIGLQAKKEELRVITEKLQALTDHLDKVNKDKQELEDRVTDTDTKLTRAKKLIEGLGGEKARFAHESERYEAELQCVVGNVVVSAGVVAYMGPFLHKYRLQITQRWREMCEARQLRVSADYGFAKFCGSPIQIQEWKLQQLPSDPFSIDNAVILSNSSRWPLLVDPQQQANAWIRNRERDNDVVVVRLSERDYLRTIRRAITDGRPVLLENVEETLDPMLENLLLKRLTKEGAVWVVHLGEAVEWNPAFRFYMTTKLPRPHYLPEVSAKVTLINFRITEQGLQDQLLQRVMMSERRDVEEKKQALTLEAAANQAGLKATEDRILAILSAEGNILESETAIEELDNSKEQSDRIAKRQEEIEAMERISDRTRNQFIPVAYLGAILFFCVMELANIDPMYQNSLQSYMSIFQEALANSAKANGPESRNEAINTTFKHSLYQRICRALFARDQLLFSFIMSLKIFEVDPALLRWVLMGGFEEEDAAAHAAAANPFSWLPDINYRLLRRASVQLDHFARLVDVVQQHEMFFMDFYDASNPLELTLPGELGALSSMEKMVVVRCLRMDKVVLAVRQYVSDTLGEYFVEPPLYALETVVDELAHDPSVPIIFVLSPGADPNAELDRVAELRGMAQRKLFKLSLGQGQDVPACELLGAGTREGHWVLLQNCHLYADFMPRLSRMIEDYSDVTAKGKLHRDYRLWLTSLPSDVFPIAILQNGVKLVQEPPKGLKSNLLQSYLSDPVADADFFHGAANPAVWQKLLFGLCFFHAVVQERRQFGPLGWNRPYEFNDTDRRISVRQLQMLLNENELVPYEALLYLIGECNYGGRVTDDWDRRCLMATLQVYLTPLALQEDYVFSRDTTDYFAPPQGEYQSYVDYIQALPNQQPPTIFGLHENADITKDERDARVLLDTTLSTQPRDAPAANTTAGSGSSAKMDPKTTVKTLAADVLHRLPPLFDVEAIQTKYPIDYAQSMNTVLMQEAIRYNRLLAVVRKSLVGVQDAISGKVVMSSELEQVFLSMYDGKVPELWRKRSYPSLKPLGAYVTDLVARLRFMQTWYEQGPPPMFWLSGFFFTQSFLTGVMQNYARKNLIEIDKLVWDFTVETAAPHTFTAAPADGCYVNGLFLEGAGWDGTVLAESKPKELFVEFPVLKLVPVLPEDVAQRPVYRCPCYKTTDRKGVLSTTGHSTNFILTISLPRDPQQAENHWVLRGTALFTQLDY